MSHARWEISDRLPWEDILEQRLFRFYQIYGRRQEAGSVSELHLGEAS